MNRRKETVIVWLWRYGLPLGVLVGVPAMALSWAAQFDVVPYWLKWVALPFLLLSLALASAFMYVNGWNGETYGDLRKRWNIPERCPETLHGVDCVKLREYRPSGHSHGIPF